MKLSEVFVTGGTGLLGNNLVRALVARGIRVRVLVRDLDKAGLQFAGLTGVECVRGDMQDVSAFASRLNGVDVLFHTAAYFRESYEGGSHWQKLKTINVDGTRDLLQAAIDHGIHRIIHTSSIAVLDGPRGAVIDERMTRRVEDTKDDYYRSKILSDEVVFEFLSSHPEVDVRMILPGWMHGPGDLGPTSAGQFALDYLKGALPGAVPGTVSYVDARDVAEAMIAAVSRGRRGERYLVAGRHLSFREVMQAMEEVTGVPSPKRHLPVFLLWAVASFNEIIARTTGRKVLLSLATVRNLRSEFERTRFDHSKSQRELGVSFRPLMETIRDEARWFLDHGWLDSVDPRFGLRVGGA